jgi:hypothetical protein
MMIMFAQLLSHEQLFNFVYPEDKTQSEIVKLETNHTSLKNR